jgi:hypothetical protein
MLVCQIIMAALVGEDKFLDSPMETRLPFAVRIHMNV